MADSDDSTYLPVLSLPLPPVQPTLDLRRLWWLKLDVTALLNSTFNTTADDTGWRCGVTLWLKAWHQIPAASLPDDDAMLCHMAGLGRDLATWERVKPIALHGFTKCSDGRLYHAFLAAQAIEAWAEFERVSVRRTKDRERKRTRNARDTPTGIPAENPLQDSTEQYPPSPLPAEAGSPAVPVHISAGRSPNGRRRGQPECRAASMSESTMDAQWRCRLAAGPSKPWLSSWGPPPGQPGCEAPPALIAASLWRQHHPAPVAA